jgi:hypothetical protein
VQSGVVADRDRRGAVHAWLAGSSLDARPAVDANQAVRIRESLVSAVIFGASSTILGSETLVS